MNRTIMDEYIKNSSWEDIFNVLLNAVINFLVCIPFCLLYPALYINLCFVDFIKVKVL